MTVGDPQLDPAGRGRLAPVRGHLDVEIVQRDGDFHLLRIAELLSGFGSEHRARQAVLVSAVGRDHAHEGAGVSLLRCLLAALDLRQNLLGVGALRCLGQPP